MVNTVLEYGGCHVDTPLCGYPTEIALGQVGYGQSTRASQPRFAFPICHGEFGLVHFH